MQYLPKILLLSAVIFLSFTLALAQDTDPIIGKWKTIDDETGDAKSIVEIYEVDGAFYGKVIELFRKPGEDPDPVCDKCPDDDPRKDQKVMGMVILEDLKKKGDEYGDGKILDPKKGKIYDCKMWLEDGDLKVRGYLFFFYRTQTWYRAD